MWYIHTMDYNSAIKKNKIMPFVATWMEIRKKDKYNIIYFLAKDDVGLRDSFFRNL